MTRDEFISRVREELMEMLPEELTKGMEIQETTVTKSNDQKHHGLTFKKETSEAAPTIYLDDAYARFTQGEDLHTLTAELKDAYIGSLGMQEPQKIDFDYDKIKDKLTVRLLEIKRNRDFLSDTPYMTVGHGLAMVCDIKMRDGDEGSWRATVTQSMLESQHYDKRELFMAAMDNAQLIDPPILVDMGQALFTHEGENLLKRSEPLPPEDVSNTSQLSLDQRIKLLSIQDPEMVLMKRYEAIVPHPAKLFGKSRPVKIQVICHVLTVEGNIEFRFVFLQRDAVQICADSPASCLG